MSFNRKFFGAVFLLFTNASCATKVMVFKTNEPAKVSTLDAGQLDAPEVPLGETPLTIELKTLEGKVVKFSQSGKQPVYWFVANAAGDRTEAVISLPNDPAAAAATNSGSMVDSKATTNRVLRLLMKSYQALSGKRYETARELAQQAAAINPEIAAPEVIKGLSLFQEGKTEEARTALLKAKALDPQDEEINQLLKIVTK